ncbi:MAG: hypothetical protein JWN31_893 [Frankiales bacterium]|nr:hypothetical protein [Frankiales bacterium]
MRAAFTTLALLLALVTGGQAVAATTPPNVGQCAAGLGIALLEVPKTSLKDPRARNYVVDSVKPGASFSRKFQVCNGTHSPVNVSLYPDAATISNGVFSLAPGQGKNELTSWISVSPSTINVPSGTAAVATMHFQVPIDATAGERYAGVVADAPAGNGNGVAVRGRVGIRVYLNVGPGGAPKSDFTVDSLQAVRGADGTPAVIAQVHNTGARALDMRGAVNLSDGPGGLSAGPFDAKLGTTLKPGDTAPVLVPLNKAIRGGPWRTVIDMKSGVLERKAEAQLTFPDTVSTGTPPVKAKALPLYKEKSIVVAVAVGFIGLLFLILIVLAVREYLRRQKRARAESVASSP